jgi:hypothetical protein
VSLSHKRKSHQRRASGRQVSDFSWVQVAVTIVGSGAVTTVVSESFRARERRHVAGLEAQHRREQAHTAARDRYLDDVGQALDWLDYEGNREYGLELGDYVLYQAIVSRLSSEMLAKC